MFYYSGAQNDRGSRSVLQLNGELDIDILIKALNKSIELVPVVKSKWVVERYYYHWEVIQDFDIRDYITVTCNSEDADNFLLESIDCETSPQIKVMVYRNNGKDTLQILFTHLCFDGTSIKNFHTLISKYYTGYTHDENFVIKDSIDFNRDLWPLFKNFPLKQRLKLALTETKPSKFDYTKWTYLDSDSVERKKVLLKDVIEEDVFQKLLEKSKKNGVKINDVFVASLAKVFLDNSNVNNSPLKISCSLDLRTYIKGERKLDFTNKVSKLIIDIDKIEGESFEELLYRVSKQTKADKDNYSGLFGVETSRLLPFFLRIPQLKKGISKTYLGSSTFNISNLGVFSKDIFKFDELIVEDFFLTGSLRYQALTALFLCTMNNRVTITSIFQGSEKEIEHVKKNIEMFKLNIKNYIA